MKKILVIGEEEKVHQLLPKIENKGFEIEISDGDEEEDFKEYDVIFDLNFDDDSENFPIYAGLREKIVILSTVKQSIAEASYVFPAKVRSYIFGFNALPIFIEDDTWEISCFRANEIEHFQKFANSINIQYLQVADRVGMFRPRSLFVSLNERAKCVEEQIVWQKENELVNQWLKEIDYYGVTSVFETLVSIFEDTKDFRYFPCALLKQKYLRNHQFVR